MNGILPIDTTGILMVTGRQASHNEIAPIGKVWHQLSLYKISGDAW